MRLKNRKEKKSAASETFLFIDRRRNPASGVRLRRTPRKTKVSALKGAAMKMKQLDVGLIPVCDGDRLN
jgi:hypothetical protein